ncbi:MAG: hypothetical protein WD063_20730 [Pirellulales bacterium]
MSVPRCKLRLLLVGVAAGFACRLSAAAERTEHFDQDPNWEGRNHRAAALEPQTVRQDFGYTGTAHAGGKAGEIGGLISPAGEGAYYATEIETATFEQPLSASGTLACGDRPFHVLVGFFNADTLNEWRTPNTIALRLNGRGDVFFAYVEYCTARWRAGGDSPQSFPMVSNQQTGRMEPQGFAAKGGVHRWSLSYDPGGNDGNGAVTATIDGQTAVCHLGQGHKHDGAGFNRFGLMTVMKSADTGGELWLDDVTVIGRKFDFDEDPRWDARGNRRTYASSIVRPRCDFGYSPTHFAGGRAGGELGGLVFRGDCRYPEKMASYADRLQPLSLDGPIKAAGKVCLRRGVSDSTMLFGFFNARESMLSNPAQNAGLPASFLGISTDGPSRDGFYFSPTYRLGDHSRSVNADAGPPAIYPDGKSRDWTFDYSPAAAGGNGAITVTLAGRRVELELDRGARQSGARFDRFGMVTTWIDGNSQTIYFDDLTYTFRQD